MPNKESSTSSSTSSSSKQESSSSGSSTSSSSSSGSGNEFFIEPASAQHHYKFREPWTVLAMDNIQGFLIQLACAGGSGAIAKTAVAPLERVKVPELALCGLLCDLLWVVLPAGSLNINTVC